MMRFPKPPSYWVCMKGEKKEIVLVVFWHLALPIVFSSPDEFLMTLQSHVWKDGFLFGWVWLSDSIVFTYLFKLSLARPHRKMNCRTPDKVLRSSLCTRVFFFCPRLTLALSLPLLPSLSFLKVSTQAALHNPKAHQLSLSSARL